MKRWEAFSARPMDPVAKLLLFSRWLAWKEEVLITFFKIIVKSLHLDRYNIYQVASLPSSIRSNFISRLGILKLIC